MSITRHWPRTTTVVAWQINFVSYTHCSPCKEVYVREAVLHFVAGDAFEAECKCVSNAVEGDSRDWQGVRRVQISCKTLHRVYLFFAEKRLPPARRPFQRSFSTSLPITVSLHQPEEAAPCSLSASVVKVMTSVLPSFATVVFSSP